MSLAAYLEVFRDAPWLKSCCRPPPPRHRLLTPFRRTSSSSFFVRFSDSTDTLSCGYCVFSLTVLSITLFHCVLEQLTVQRYPTPLSTGRRFGLQTGASPGSYLAPQASPAPRRPLSGRRCVGFESRASPHGRVGRCLVGGRSWSDITTHRHSRGLMP